jgi:cysteine-rich repeat protein
MKPNAFVFVFPEPFCPDLYTVTLSHTARSLFRLVLYQIGAIAIVTTAVGAAAQAAVDFEPGLSYELSGEGPKDIIVGHFNKAIDAHVDLAIPSFVGDGDVTVLLGNGAGSFADDQPFSVPFNARGIAQGDFDGDGDWDLAVVGPQGASQDPKLRVYLGDGAGLFVEHAALDASGTPTAVVSGDFDEDGIIDLAVTDSNRGGVSTFRGLGAGSFSPRVQIAATAGLGPGDILAADFDRDGHVDLAIPQTVLLGAGDGTFSKPGNRGGHAAGDLNLDGNLDLVVVSGAQLIVWFGNGDGTFEVGSVQSVTGASLIVARVTDFNRDSLPDVAVVDETNDTVEILLGLGGGSLGTPQSFPTGEEPGALETGDWNGDGYPDLAVPYRVDPGPKIGAFVWVAQQQVPPAPGAPPQGYLQLGAPTYSVDEAIGTITIHVTRTGGTSGQVTVEYHATDGTASEAADFELASGTLVFPDGVASRSFVLAIVDDNIFEGTELAELSLASAAGGAALGAIDTAQITILDNDLACGNGIVDPPEVCDDGNTVGGDGCSATCNSTEICGNDVLDPGEVCDDGNTFGGDGCSATCDSTEVCGNGLLDPTEACDDGNTVGGDGCSATCDSTEVCGNTFLDPGEVCDDGNTFGGDGCSATCQYEICGNGFLDPGEVCDDGNTFGGDGCSATCDSTEVCGNTFLDPSEICDDGNTFGGDGCSATCDSNEICGNGLLDPGEVCDDGNTISGDGCSATCDSTEICGNGLLDPSEICDDGNTISGDGCSATCDSTEICGNTVLDPGEVCDDGNTAGGDGCSATCQYEICGNGLLDPSEICDDGNTVGGDGCSATCDSTEICGNTFLDPGEVCDDGNTFGGDGCSATCDSTEVCGNGLLDPSEICDDGNTVGGDGCSATCNSTEICGNTVLDPGEVCDDGNTFGGDGCSATCQYEICGNGLLDPSEICDDGNTVGGDGCSATCDSTEICGNGLLDPSEVCDDGNTISGDGCSATCDSTEVCGNTVLDPGEVCDDGNTIGGDGCSADCQSSDCIDNDSDGFGQLGAFSCPAGTEIDCNDDDDTIYPGNVEACNGLDDDCDESIDEGLSTDADGDGFYTTDSCMEPATDCHDVDGSVHPGVPELCDGEDNDCNGVTDDGDICNPGGELDVVTITMSKGLYREDGLISAFRPYVVEICVEGVIATASILTPNGLPELAIPMDVSESCLVESFDDASSLDEAFPNGDYRFTFDGGVDSITVAFEAVQPAAFADVIDPADGANVPSSRDLVIRWTLQPPGCAPCGDGIRVKVCNVDTDTELFSSAPLPISTDQWTVPASALQPGDELDIHVETFNGATIDSSTDGSDLLTITVTSDETNILKIPEPVSGLLQLVALLSVAFLSKTRHRN